MTRNLRRLGLALTATLVMGAVSVSTASAQQGVLTSDGPVTLLATEVGGAGANAITAFGGVVKCPGSVYTGHKAKATPHEMLESGATGGTLTPHLKNCTFNELPVTVDMNGCDIAIEGGETIKEGEYGGTGSLFCPEGKAVRVTAFSSASHAIKLCTIEAGAQGGSGEATLTNTAGGVKVSGSITGLKGSKSGLCGTATTEAGELHFSVEASGLNAEGKETPISVSD